MDDLKGIKIGYAMCGSFCTFDKSFKEMQKLVNMNAEITPIFSFNACNIDTRFGTAKDQIEKAEKISGRKIISTIEAAEPIGPEKMFDILIVAPCTGNTIAKLSANLVDTPVTMAVKSHLRNSRPVVIAVSTNDALSGSAKNIGTLLNFKNYYFVPMNQDNYEKKPNSIVADFTQISSTIKEALMGRQIQPIIYKCQK